MPYVQGMPCTYKHEIRCPYEHEIPCPYKHEMPCPLHKTAFLGTKYLVCQRILMAGERSLPTIHQCKNPTMGRVFDIGNLVNQPMVDSKIDLQRANYSAAKV